MKRCLSIKFCAIALALILVLGAGVVVHALASEQGIVRNPNGGSYVNVRARPSYDADILTRLNVGTAVEITGADGSWYSVWVNGIVAYIHSNFVAVQSGVGDGTNASVRSGPLNLREAPTMRARVIRQLYTGARVTVRSQEDTWSQVQAGADIGYVVTSYLTLDGGSTGPVTKPPIHTPNANATIRTANGGNLNLRGWGSADAPILDSFATGSRVRVLSHGSVWSQVQAGNQYGYMGTRYLAFDGGASGGTSGANAVVNNPGSNQVLNLRAEPTTDSRSLGQYRNGTEVKILAAGTEWHRVQVGSTQGYMMARYVRITGSGVSPHKTVMGGTNGYVNLRTGPGYEHGIAIRVPNGSAASVVLPYPTWSKVLVRSGTSYTTGYMLNSFLR